jgi:uncharacterized damage-inducible protein DinB
VAAIDEQVAQALDQLRRTEPASLEHVRLVGAKGLPSTVGGLLFHAAEHTQRHCGQLLVTTRVLLEATGATAPRSARVDAGGAGVDERVESPLRTDTECT